MYMIEITEDKISHLSEYVGKALECMEKAMHCVEAFGQEYDEESEMTSSHIRHTPYRNYEEDGEEDYRTRRNTMKSSNYGGRYSRY